MDTVGVYEAKTHLSSLLARVAQGEHSTITKHGASVAMLVPFMSVSMPERRAAIRELQAFRQGRRLGMDSLREMIEEGRRHHAEGRGIGEKLRAGHPLRYERGLRYG
jgi:prevent-host-death family protein